MMFYIRFIFNLPYNMFGVQLRTLLENYQITKMERKQIKNMLKINTQIGTSLTEYRQILDRVHTCTAMDDPVLKQKLLKIIKLYGELIEEYKIENRTQYDAVIKTTNEPHYYIFFMLHTCNLVLSLIQQRNKILSDIVCKNGDD